jgi:hypothetical protein
MKRTVLHFPFPLKNIVSEFAASLVEILKQIRLKEVFRYKIATQFMAKPLSPEEEEEEEKTNKNSKFGAFLRRYSTCLCNCEF